MEYEKLDLFLKKYSFKSKLKYCFNCSLEIIEVNGLISRSELMEKVYPWELETYLLFCMDFDEVAKNNLP